MFFLITLQLQSNVWRIENMPTVTFINYLGKSEKDVICLIIWKAVSEQSLDRLDLHFLLHIFSPENNLVQILTFPMTLSLKIVLSLTRL